jgi:hypothetical protein
MAKSQSMSRSAAAGQGRSKTSNAIRRSITTSRSAVKSGMTAIEEVESGPVGGGKG